MDAEAREEAKRRMGSRVRVYYRTRVYRSADGAVHNVFGDNEVGVDDVATAHLVGRLLRVDARHVLVHADGAPRPVAIHAASIQRVTTPLIGVR